MEVSLKTSIDPSLRQAKRITNLKFFLPVGRETVLYPVTWNANEWPILQPVRGKMSGWALPPPSRDLPGTGPFNSDPDVYDFDNKKGSSMPRNLVHWRVPRKGTFTTTERGLQIVPSRNNLTGTPLSSETPELSGQKGLAFIGRRQTDTLFEFSVDLSFDPVSVGQEAGVTVFLTQVDHIDLGVVLLESTPAPAPKTSTSTSSSSSSGSDGPSTQANPNPNPKPELSFRFRAEGSGPRPAQKVVPVPKDWVGEKLRLQIQTVNSTHYSLAVMLADKPKPKPGKPQSQSQSGSKLVIGTASAELVSGGNGSFVGSLVGAYATCNGAGSGVTCPPGGNAYFNRWRYTGQGQYVSATELIY